MNDFISETSFTNIMSTIACGIGLETLWMATHLSQSMNTD
jgi:hypothetical protein